MITYLHSPTVYLPKSDVYLFGSIVIKRIFLIPILPIIIIMCGCVLYYYVYL